MDCNRGGGLLGGVIAFIAGAFVGAAVGIMFAPAAGRDTRDQIKHRAEDLVDQGREAYDEQRKRVLEAVESGKQQAAEKSEEIKTKIESAREKLKEGIDQVADYAGDKVESLKKLEGEEDAGGAKGAKA
jgi:gas vesicle protein